MAHAPGSSPLLRIPNSLVSMFVFGGHVLLRENVLKWMWLPSRCKNRLISRLSIIIDIKTAISPGHQHEPYVFCVDSHKGSWNILRACVRKLDVGTCIEKGDLCLLLRQRCHESLSTLPGYIRSLSTQTWRRCFKRTLISSPLFMYITSRGSASAI